ncbi:hypothetical protein AYO38_00430, partial [bacterium SCGC AG-212-C10]
MNTVTRVTLAALCALAIQATLVFGVAVHAQSPGVPQLDGAVTDLSDAADVSSPGTSLSRLEEDRNYQLYSLFIDSTDSRPISDYTDDVVRLNNLGAADALLVVAVRDRTYQLWLGDTIAEEVSQGEQDRLLANGVEPRLRAGDYTGAVAAAADGIRSNSGSSAGSGSNDSSSGNESGSSGGFSIWWVVLPLIFFAGLPIFMIWSLRREAGSIREPGERATPGSAGQRSTKAATTEQLHVQANELLLKLDEAVHEAQQELGFAEARAGEAGLDEFLAAIDGARDGLRRAFAARQLLDDGTPDSPAMVRSTLESVIAECESALNGIADEYRKIADERKLEQDAPNAIKRLRSDLAALESRIPDTVLALSRFESQAPSGSQPVSGNLPEARKRIALAQDSLARGEQAAGNDGPVAAREVRIAQNAIAEAKVLLDAINNLAAQLAEAQSNLPARLAEAEQSMQAASERAAASGRAVPELVEVRRQLEEARRVASASPPDLLAAYQLARHADASADELVASLMKGAADAERDASAASHELSVARGEYERASDYIRGRRASVGSEARTRLAEAERYLSSAQSFVSSEPRQSLEHARRASTLANEAYRLAANDFDDRQTWGGGNNDGLGGIL